MAAATDQERFEAAVKIITGLPKDGPFQPSNDMKLKFYGLYKQATIGPCTSGQPAFWDVVNRAKWSAWKALGEMSKEDAMRNYVEILKQVVETMTLDANVQDFLEKMGPIYEFVTDDGRVVSKTSDINSYRPDAAALAMLDLTKGGQQKYINGAHSTEKNTPINGNGIPNGRGINHMSSEESELDDDVGARHRHQERQFVPSIAVRKIDLEGASDEEEFDDATDNQISDGVAVDIALIQSSGTHSPLSYGSTPRRSSKAVQSNDESANNVGAIKSGPLSTSVSVIDQLSPSRRRAAAALGQLLRQLPELASGQGDADAAAVAASDSEPNAIVAGGRSSEDSIVRAWSVLRRIHAEQVQRAQDDDDWLIRRLKYMKRGKGHRKHRGRGGQNGAGGHGGNDDGGGSSSADRNASGVPLHASGANGDAASTSRRSQRQLSGESGSTSSSSGDSANLDFDPHVGAVLLRMHRELQHINRQLELVEGILITQQQMIRNVMAKTEEAEQKRMRVGFFSNLPWRTILFILAWPVVVNIVVRICIFRMRRRR